MSGARIELKCSSCGREDWCEASITTGTRDGTVVSGVIGECIGGGGANWRGVVVKGLGRAIDFAACGDRCERRIRQVESTVKTAGREQLMTEVKQVASVCRAGKCDHRKFGSPCPVLKDDP